MSTLTIDRLLRDNEELTRRLEEAEAALFALRAGEVDAVFVEAGQEQVLTLETADKPYRLLVEQMTQAAATLTTEGKIIYCNRLFADQLRRPLHGLLGKAIDEFVSADSRTALEALLEEAKQREVRGEISLQRADESYIATFVGITTLQEGALGQCFVITDLTEQRRYEELQRTQAALRASEERLDLAQRAGRVGTFEWDIQNGTLSWSATNEELYGLPVGSFGGRYEDWLRAVHPADRERAETDRLRAVAEQTDWDTEFRIVRPDGTTRWIVAKGKVYYSADGTPIRMLGVNLDITDRKQAEEQLREADRKKDVFLATLSHELRNPLAPMRNAVSVLKTASASQSQVTWARDVIDRQLQLMTRLLEDLLDVSRISTRKLELRMERIELAEVLEAALESSRPLIDQHALKLRVRLPHEPIYLTADGVRLSQVFCNLLNNAAKYTDAGGEVCLTAEQHGAHVVVSVKDTGMGIAPDMLPRIFDVFAQSPEALRRSQGGLGIGLSLAKGLVELHHGSIEARSNVSSRGSEFIVRLPLDMDPSAAGPSRRAGALETYNA